MGARERVLDAAALIMERDGFGAVNVAAVAHQAGVSRQTVYARFGTREELVSQAIQRIVGEVFDVVNTRIEATTDAADYVIELLVASRHEFRQRAVLGAMLLPNRDSPLFDNELLAAARGPAATFLQPLLDRAPGLADRFDDVVEFLIRFGVSILLFDSDVVRSDDDLAAFMRRMIVPVLFPPTG